MKSIFFAALFSALPLLGQASSPSVPRPKITGVSHLAVYASDATKTAHFYEHDIGCLRDADFETPNGTDYAFNTTQAVEVLPLPPNAGVDRLDHIAFATSDADGLRRYLASQQIIVPSQVTTTGQGIQWFEVKDFEGNRVQFVQGAPFSGNFAADKDLIGHHIIHIGMLIRDRLAADHFYRDILGFKLYWHGGMQPDKTDWVAMQVPDGTDWLEYMLTSGPSGSGIPTNMTQHQLGVLNHLSVGVRSMSAAAAELKNGDRLDCEHVGPQIGKDGKWQFNLFDPDMTRVELMEFTPVEKPCCAPFTGPHPTPSM